MFTVETNLMGKVPIIEHSSVSVDELAAVLLTIWSRYKMEPQATERWVQQTCNYLATVREMLGSNDTNMAVFVVRGLVSEVRHLNDESILRLIDEVIERKQLGVILSVLGLKADSSKTPDGVMNALANGLVVPFNSPELVALELREVEARFVAALMLLAGVSDDGAIYDEDLAEILRDYASANLNLDVSASEFSTAALKELLHLNCKLTIRQLKNMSDEQQEALRAHTSMGTMTEVYAKVKQRKEVLFEDSELNGEEEPQVQTYPSLTMEGVVVGKAISYTLGRMPLEKRREALVNRLIEEQKKRSILLFSKPGDYTLTSAECMRLSDFASRFVFDIFNRLDMNKAQDRLLELVTEVKLLNQA